MADINNIVIFGRITKDAEISYTPTGIAVAKFSIASNRSKKVDGKWEEETFFFDVQFIGKRAESLKTYLTKGQAIAVDGNLRQDRWEYEGKKYSKIYIFANDLQLCGGKKSDNGNAQNGSSYDDEEIVY